MTSLPTSGLGERTDLRSATSAAWIEREDAIPSGARGSRAFQDQRAPQPEVGREGRGRRKMDSAGAGDPGVSRAANSRVGARGAFRESRD
jgi:hypothetical protein